MKIRIVILLTLLLSISEVAADTTASVELKGGYFFFASKTMRDVYKDGGFEVGASTSIPVWRWLHIYASIGFLEAWGKSTHLHQKTNIWEIPVDLGLKPLFKIASFAQYYLAMGPRYFYVQQHNHSSYVTKKIGRNGVGLFVNTGFNFFPIPHFLINFFAEYAYEPTHFSSSKPNVYGGSLQLSKFTFGTGLGYQF